MTQFAFGLLIGGTVGYFTACLMFVIFHDKED